MISKLYSMRPIKSRQELLQNLETVERYLSSNDDTETSQIHNLIRLGACFLCYKINGEIRFAPSRFIGYANNNIGKHHKNRAEIDGRITNVQIIKTLEQMVKQNAQLDKELTKFCASLGFLPANKKHKFWILELTEELNDNTLLFGEFPEGKIVERKHKARERNSKVIDIAKSNFLKKNKKLYCEVCGFDFETKYGSIGKYFIEGHHTIPVSEMSEGHMTKPEDIALLCSNCHRMVHKKRPWLKKGELHKILKT